MPNVKSERFYEINRFEFGCVSCIVEVQRNSINRIVFDSLSEWLGKWRGDKERH
jgi:hypothetical protein